MLFVLLFAAVIVGGFFAYAYVTRTVRAGVAQSRAEAFVSRVYAEYTVVGKNCQSEDTDGDAYVSCDVRIKSGADERTLHLQCPTVWKTLLGNTCKETRVILQ